MVQAMPLADLDFLVKVDTWELVSYKTERAKAALELGEEDRAFVRFEHSPGSQRSHRPLVSLRKLSLATRGRPNANRVCR